MADYFYACYNWDVPLPSGPRQVETSTTTHPSRATLASRWTLRPEWRQRLHKSFLAISVRVLAIKGIISKVDVRQKHVLVDNGLLFDLQVLFTRITAH